MKDKYEKGSILKYDNGDQFLVCERLKLAEEQYLLVTKLDEEISQKVVIDYKNMMMLKVLSNDDTLVEDDEKVIRKVYNKMLEQEKLEFNSEVEQ